MTEFNYIVKPDDEGLEVKDIVRSRFDFSSRLRKRISREKLTMRNGIAAEGWHKVSAGDVIRIVLPDEQSHFIPQKIPLDIIYEDEHLMLINKQPGLVVHPTKGHPVGTVANALSYRMDQIDNHWKIRFVNRLDMDTSGLLLVAKNAYCQNTIVAQMRDKTVEKKYTAIIQGIPEPPNGEINAPIGRPDPEDVRRGVTEDGHPSLTYYKTVERLRNHSVVELTLKTGRTHQIRVHMSYIGHPVLGDHLYGEENIHIISRQALHASSLSFVHPMTKEYVHFTAPLPKDMAKAIEMLR